MTLESLAKSFFRHRTGNRPSSAQKPPRTSAAAERPGFSSVTDQKAGCCSTARSGSVGPILTPFIPTPTAPADVLSLEKASSVSMSNQKGTAKMFNNVIWEGRFQPIHVGHLAYIKRLMEHGTHVWIVVVANEQSTDLRQGREQLPVPEFTDTVDPHHVPEKNILPFWLRYRLVTETLRKEFGPDAPITVMGGRRLDLAWDLYAKILPPDRVFLTPERDSFEDVKAAAWAKLGENCHRIDVSDLPKISATMVRDRIKAKQPTAGLLAPHTEEVLREQGYINSLAEL